MVAEHGDEETADFEGTPIPEDVASGAGDPGRLEAVIEQLKGQIQKLQQQLNMKTSTTHNDSHKLKPIDVKDIEKPDTYDNNVSKFVTWYDRFRDLLEKRHPHWEYVFNAIESVGRNKIMDTKVRQPLERRRYKDRGKHPRSIACLHVPTQVMLAYQHRRRAARASFAYEE